MTLTSFLDVKADPPKPDETKIDLLRNLSNETALVTNNGNTQQLPVVDPLETVEYVELYNHRLAKRRRLCRTLAWLLAAFLLLDIGVVLYVGLRMRHTGSEQEHAATVTCRLRFRSSEQPDRTELITMGNRRVLMQPMWAADGRPTVMHDLFRGFTLLRAPSARLCFIRRVRHSNSWANSVSRWAKEPHDVQPEQTRFVRLIVKQPALSLDQLMFYGTAAWNMCSRYRTHLVEPIIVDHGDDCPMRKCLVCPSGVYLRDSDGCQTCECGPAPEASPALRTRRHAGGDAGLPRKLELDEGVLPDDNGRAVHTIDVIEF